MNDHSEPMLVYSKGLHYRGGPFVVRYILIAVLGLLVGGIRLLLHRIILVTAVVLAYDGHGLAIDVLSYFSVSFCLDWLLLVGSIASIPRARWSHKWLLIFATGDLIVVGVGLLTLGLGSLTCLFGVFLPTLAAATPGWVLCLVLYLLIRGAHAWACRVAYTDLRADLYFDDLPPLAETSAAETGAAASNEAADPAPRSAINRANYRSWLGQDHRPDD